LTCVRETLAIKAAKTTERTRVEQAAAAVISTDSAGQTTEVTLMPSEFQRLRVDSRVGNLLAEGVVVVTDAGRPVPGRDLTGCAEVIHHEQIARSEGVDGNAQRSVTVDVVLAPACS
jgi:hypothetical protein